LVAAVVFGGDTYARAGRSLKRAAYTKPAATPVYPGLQRGTMVVKFNDDLDISATRGKVFFRDGRSVVPVNRLIDRGVVLRAEPAFESDRARLSEWRRRGEARAGVKLADLTTYFRLTLRPDQSIHDAAKLADELNGSPFVDIAYLEGTPEEAVDIPPPTPSYDTIQAYLFAAPGGVDAYASWSYPGGKGEGVTICDIEIGWQTDHEDLSALVGHVIGGTPSPSDHGTAVMGEMVGDSTDYGITGISYMAEARMISVSYRSTENALLLAGDNLNVGDIVLIELHQPGPNSTGSGQYGYVPMEWTPAVFDAIQTLTANGLIVCEAAGNGSQNLEDPVYDGWFDPHIQYSGAIMCGAGAPPSGIYGPDRSRLGFSNYGARVELQGYGYGVVTTGYGGLFNPGDNRQLYTATFSGTSSASPIVTASVACVQGRFKSVSGGYTMTAGEIGDLLINTGSPQTTNTSEHIGPRPDLGTAIPLVAPLSAYVNPRTVNVSLIDPRVVVDTVWLVNPHVLPTTFSITTTDSLPAALAPPTVTSSSDKDAMRAWNLAANVAYYPNWISVDPASGSVPAGDSVPIAVTLDGNMLPSSYFGDVYKGRLNVLIDGAAGDWLVRVPVYALSQDSIHGDTIQVVTADVNHRATSETNMQGWSYNDSTVLNFLYDGSFVVARRYGGDTLAYRDLFGTQLWRGRGAWAGDSTSFPRYTAWSDSTMSNDSAVGLAYEAWVPTSGDSADFVLWRIQLYGRKGLVYLASFGAAADWDLPSTSGANNYGGVDTARQMVYQTGNGSNTNYAAGMALLRTPAVGGAVGSNPDDVYPTGGFTPSRLYEQMTTSGFRVDGSDIDLHCILSAFKGTIPMSPPLEFELVFLSSRTDTTGLQMALARAQELSDTLRYISCPVELTGDVNVDGVLTSADIIYLVGYVFKAGPPPQPIALSGDVDCSGATTSADIIYLVNFVFKSGPAPCDVCTLY